MKNSKQSSIPLSSKQQLAVNSKKHVHETNEIKKVVLQRAEAGESLHKLSEETKISRSTLQVTTYVLPVSIGTSEAKI